MAVSQQCSHQSFIACHKNRGQATCGSFQLAEMTLPRIQHALPQVCFGGLRNVRVHKFDCRSTQKCKYLMKNIDNPTVKNIPQISGNIPSFKETLCPVKTTDSFPNNEAVTASYVKYALIHQSQTFVALRGLDGDITPNGGLGWEVVSKINKALQLRNYKQSAAEKERKPAKQFVACCIFNSLSAWHKDGCQTTEETSRGMTERNGKRKRALRWGNFPFRVETHTHPYFILRVFHAYSKRYVHSYCDTRGNVGGHTDRKWWRTNMGWQRKKKKDRKKECWFLTWGLESLNKFQHHGDKTIRKWHSVGWHSCCLLLSMAAC